MRWLNVRQNSIGDVLGAQAVLKSPANPTLVPLFGQKSATLTVVRSRPQIKQRISDGIGSIVV